MAKKATAMPLSTGPKTKAGKKASSMNAVKHGLTAKNRVNEQERDQYQYLLDALIEEYELQTSTELMLAERVANIATRSRRFQVVEDALFATAREQASNTTTLIDSYELDDDTATDAASVILGILNPLNEFNGKLYQELFGIKDPDEISGYSYVIQNLPELRKQLFRVCRKEHCDIAKLIGGKGSFNQHKQHETTIRIIRVSDGQDKTDEELDESGLKVTSNDIRAYIRELKKSYHRRLKLYYVIETHKQREE